MMVYRLGRPSHIEDLSGTGAKLFGGRWNSEGFPVLYASENSSLCILEVLAHSASRYLEEPFNLAVIWLDEALSISSFSLQQLPANWNSYPHGTESQQLGTTWLKNQKHPILKVPSAVNIFEHNLLLNPALINPEQIKIVALENFTFDQRLTL